MVMGHSWVICICHIRAQIGVKSEERTRVDKRVFWPQYFRKIEYVCLIGF